ncbi:PepSY domain-containing protein [Methylobacterium sp. SD274]|uniref:PepSY-associated TM helix domain-containing protein n=1 Tax=Methylobacterium sp. SD274 TaxID=2782009 RepID=UPI001A961802|nr:PepSY-associated TM helix domain-containing protein [Methylobacterium sp. SD274]MBO1021614.1 PepSY domain-containing protein [Methylobacterium sp. SD274]
MTTRTVLFRLHWLLGLTAGLVLALVGVTGALLSYEEALTEWANADRAFVTASDAPRLSPAALKARVEAQQPGRVVSSLALWGDPERSPRIRFANDPAMGARPPTLYLDPVDGRTLGEMRLEDTFVTIRKLHRWLLLPGDGKGWGRSITGICAIALLVFLATGLYLRWPKLHTWKIWLKPSLKRPGRPRWWSLHTIAGTWLVPFYAAIALTGLWWSFDSYRNAATWLLTGETRAPRAARGPGAPPQTTGSALDTAWATFSAGEGAGAHMALIALPGPEQAAIRIRFLATASDLPKARDEATFDPATGARLSQTRFADKPLGRQMAENMLEVHRGRFFGGFVAFLFFAASLAMPLFAATGLTLYVLRRGARRRRLMAAAPAGAGTIRA